MAVIHLIGGQKSGMLYCMTKYRVKPSQTPVDISLLWAAHLAQKRPKRLNP